MKRLLTSALGFLVVAACNCLLACQGALSYSVKDDVEAARSYKAKSDHNAMAATIYQQGVDLLATQRYQQALPMLEEVTRLDPRCGGAYSSLAYCQTWLEYYTEGAESLTKAIALDSTRPIYFYRKALCHWSTGAMEEAISELNHALGLRPNDADSLRLRARSYHSLTNHEADAIADFSQLIKNNAFTVEALCERGKLHAQTGADEKALQDFDAALKIKPDEAEAFVGRANVFYKQHNYRLALDNYTAAIVYGSDKVKFCRVQCDVCRRFANIKKAPATLNAAGTQHDSRTK